MFLKFVQSVLGKIVSHVQHLLDQAEILDVPSRKMLLLRSNVEIEGRLTRQSAQILLLLPVDEMLSLCSMEMSTDLQ